MTYSDDLPIPYKFLELCKYQQEIIKQYEEYIEKHIVAKILETDIPESGLFGPKEVVYKRITIPESTIVMRCDPYVVREWDYLKAQTPLIDPNYFLHVAYKEREERQNAKAN
jgi:hypothetical protein